jgi:hypothetical protein
VINKLLSALTSFRLRSRDRVDDPLAQLLSHMPPARDFVIAIDGWSKKAIYIERYDADSGEAEARRDAINADASLDTAFIVQTNEDALRMFGPDVLYEWHLETKARMREFDPPPSAV